MPAAPCPTRHGPTRRASDLPGTSPGHGHRPSPGLTGKHRATGARRPHSGGINRDNSTAREQRAAAAQAGGPPASRATGVGSVRLAPPVTSTGLPGSRLQSDGRAASSSHYHRNLFTRGPKSAQPWVSTWCGPYSSSPVAPPSAPSTPRSSLPWRRSSPTSPPAWMGHPMTSWPSSLPPRNLTTGVEQYSPICLNKEIRAGPRWSAYARAGIPSSASLVPFLPSSGTNGPKATATWDRKSSPPAATP